MLNFCENLVKIQTLSIVLMVILGVLLINPVLADDNMANTGSSEEVDCVAYARAKVKEAGLPSPKKMNAEQRRQVKGWLSECRNKTLDAKIAEQEKTLAEQEKILKALDEELAGLNLQIDENNRILDEQGQELARIVEENGKLKLHSEQLDDELKDIEADTKAKLDAIEQYLRDNS